MALFACTAPVLSTKIGGVERRITGKPGNWLVDLHGESTLSELAVEKADAIAMRGNCFARVREEMRKSKWIA